MLHALSSPPDGRAFFFAVTFRVNFIQYLQRTASVHGSRAPFITSRLTFMQQSKLIGVGLSCIGLLTAVSVGFARVPKGITVLERTPAAVAFRYTPNVKAWDTVVTHDGKKAIRPVIDGVVVRTNRSGTDVQWVMDVDIIVPGPAAFRVDRAEVKATDLVNALPFEVQVLDPVYRQTSAPLLDGRWHVAYAGIAGDRHLASVSIVVASRSAEGVTTITTSANFRVVFNGPAAQVAGTAPSSLDVLNPRAPWQITTQVRSEKTSERSQGAEFTDVYRMSIDREGFYRVTSDQLRSVGIPTDAAAATSLKVYGRGGRQLPESVDSSQASTLREQPIIVRQNPDGSVRDVTFYAQATMGWEQTRAGIRHYIHHYAREAGYYLTVGGTPGRRASARPAAAGAAIVTPSVVTGRVAIEDELQSPYSPGSGRRWYGRSIESVGSTVYQTVLPGLVRTGNVEYAYVVAHRSTAPGTVSISENGAVMGQTTISAVPKYMDAFTAVGSASIPAQQMAADGRSVVRFAYTSTDRAASGMLDWLEIHYPRQLQADGGVFQFWTVPDKGTHEYTVNGFSGEVFGADVTDPSRPELVENVSTIGGAFTIRETCDSVRRRYFIASSLQQTSLSRIPFPDLRNTPRAADLIIITHPSLRGSAQRYADYRTSRREVTARVVTTDEIFTEFSYGMQDPTAIRDFIAMAYSTWTPRPTAILLWGDGHFDYKNLASSQPNLVPPYESLDPDAIDYGLYTYTTDDFFVRVVGDDRRPDLAIGRIPVMSDAQGDRMHAKIKAYETTSSRDDWRTRITLIADDGQQGDGLSDGAMHLNQNESLARYFIPAAFQARRIYLVEYPTENVARGRRKPSVTEDMVSSINTSGSLILNWIGHGNPRVWAHEQIFVRETTPQMLTNVNKPFFLTAATCDFARWDMSDIQSGAEELLLMENGGAIGVFSAARVVFSLSNAALNEEFYSDLFERDEQGRYPTLGKSMFRVKQRFTSNNDEKFHLLCDPTLRLLVPENNVRFTKINGTAISDTMDPVTIAALSTVIVEGEITGARDVLRDDTFTGSVAVSLLDGSRTITVVDNDVNQTVNAFSKSGPALCRGAFAVADGRFTATFVVPKDISFSTQRAGLYGYAASDDDRYAMGVTRNIVVDGVTSVIDPESNGPDMQIYLDSRNFVPGSIVRKNPILIVDLEDATGINSTGVGIGHDIEATFDGETRTEVLTPYFATSITNSRAGSVQKQLFGLADGLHTVTVRAWDVLNNVSWAQTSFRITSASPAIVAERLMNYPNPFTTRTTIRFVHASQLPFNADLLLYDMEGRLIREQAMRIIDMQTADTDWDGRDALGAPMPTGSYQAVVRLISDQGATSFVSGKLTLIR